MSEYISTKDRMSMFNIRPVKGLGQNFLRDKSVMEDIVTVSDVTKDDTVIEIGPGLGIMTECLAQRAKHVIAVEIDDKLIDPLKYILRDYDNVELINDDILKLDIPALLGRLSGRVRVVANLPYYITTPIIMCFLEGDFKKIESLTFMVQKEVAQRMTAEPGGKEYGAMTVCVNYFSECKICFYVPPSAFIPMPGVDSCVVRLDIRKEPPFDLKDKEFFFKIVKASFCQRRKMLVNSLANCGYLGITKEEVADAVSIIGKDEKIRGEVLSPYEFAKLSNILLS